MPTTVTIGDFSRLTLLSVKALRHYHEVGLLAPAEIDPSSGYRRYDVAQVETAQLIRRLRDLDMPVPDVRSVVLAPDPQTRDELLRQHLDRMETSLARTREVVASLRLALDPLPDVVVEHRHLPAQPVLAVRFTAGDDTVADAFSRAFPALHATLGAAGALPVGPGGAVWSHEWFEDDEGEVIAFVPVLGPDVVAPAADQEVLVLEPIDVAVGIHAGAFTDFDRTYGALGRHVAEHCGSSGRPIRELYVIGPERTDDPDQYRTEICWPIGPA